MFASLRRVCGESIERSRRLEDEKCGERDWGFGIKGRLLESRCVDVY